MSALDVLAPGPLTTVQDLGRPGLAAVGVTRSGAADRASLRLANRLVGNPEAAAALEVTYGGLRVRATGDLVVAMTGALCGLRLRHNASAVEAPAYSVVRLPAGAELSLGAPTAGVRSYLAVRGGLDVAPVLGSRSSDLLAGLGPAPLVAGQRLPVGRPSLPLPSVDHAPVAPPATGEVVLRVALGPRADWLTADALALLLDRPWEVSPASNRVGLRLIGPVLARARVDELASEGLVLGAVQVPPSGQPVVFLADHPVTGGYPVVAVVVGPDVDRAAQLGPGQRVRFALAAARPAPGFSPAPRPLRP